MTRSRATARQAGTKWETAIVAILINHGWPHAEPSTKRGDIDGIPGVVVVTVAPDEGSEDA